MPSPIKGGTVAPQGLEEKVDELHNLVKSHIERKTGFAEDHIKSRYLQKIFSTFDLDHTGELTPVEWEKALDFMNLAGTPDERLALFSRFDMNGNQILSFKEVGDGVFGLTRVPMANPEVRCIVKKFKDKMSARAGENAVRGLTRSLVLMDKDKSNELCKEELFNGLQRYGIQCTLQDVDVLLKNLDRDGNHMVSITELLRCIRGFMPKKREQFVQMAYRCLDKNGDQSVTLDEIARCYDVSAHPLVKKGTKSPNEVLTEFMSMWDKSGDAVITWEEFLDYYKDISANIEDDAYFELMMRNAWHLSGGEGASQNTTCRRVLVTFKDGRQSIEEIKNDLGIGPKDIDKMKRALEEQGLKDVSKIEIYGAA